MNTTVNVYFIGKDNQRIPFVRNDTVLSYTNDCSEGSITFEGHYYVEDHAPPYNNDSALPIWKRSQHYSDYLPQMMELFVEIRETNPYKEEIIEKHYHKIEIYKRIFHEDSTVISYSNFPPNKQTIYFHILDQIGTH